METIDMQVIKERKKSPSTFEKISPKIIKISTNNSLKIVIMVVLEC